MTNKKRPTQRPAAKNIAINNTTHEAQIARLVYRLRLGRVDTFTIMRELNICRPGARICDLREAGYGILTDRITLTDEWGRAHYGVAMYTLISEPVRGVAA